MATETKEVRISYTSVQILCTKSVGGAPSVMSTPIKSVGISKGIASTEQDIVPSTHIVPFAGCNYMGQCVACVPKGKWKLPAESTVNVVKRVPLVEDSEFECTKRGGKITFNFDPVKTVPPANKKPNIIDNAQAKINSAANSVVKNSTKALKDATESMTAAFDGLKPVLENTQAANLATSLDTQVQKLNQLKKQTDSRVEDLDNEITELKKKIEAKLTGTPYTPPKDQEKETEIQVTTTKDEIDLQNTEEEKRNEALYDEATSEAIQEYESFINTSIAPTTIAREVEVEKENPSTNPENSKASTTSLTTKNVSEKENNTTKKYLDQLSRTSKTLGLDKNEDTREALKILDNMDAILVNDAKSGVTEKAKVVIQNERNTLNSKVQASIEEELTELEYYEKLKKYKEESNELQKDIDKASLALKSMGDFGGFIDGLQNKYLGKIGAKYSESLNKFSNNLATLNTSMDGLSYMADGFPKGEVFTKVVREIEENEDKDDKNGDGSIFGSLDDVLNDRNTEPRILRIYAVYAQNPEEGETYKKGDTVTQDAIPPGIRVDLIIQSNGKANGEIVDLNLQGRTFHYRQVGKDKDDTDRIIENITLQGDSPDFEKGESYDVSDPNYALDASGKRKVEALNDKTKVKFISRLPIEEEQEEELF